MMMFTGFGLRLNKRRAGINVLADQIPVTTPTPISISGKGMELMLVTYALRR